MLCILTSVLHHYLKIDYTEVGEIIVIRWSIFEGANLVTSNVCEYWKYRIPILCCVRKSKAQNTIRQRLTG